MHFFFSYRTYYSFYIFGFQLNKLPIPEIDNSNMNNKPHNSLIRIKSTRVTWNVNVQIHENVQINFRLA